MHQWLWNAAFFQYALAWQQGASAIDVGDFRFRQKKSGAQPDTALPLQKTRV